MIVIHKNRPVFIIDRFSTFTLKKVDCEYAYFDKNMKLIIRLPHHHLDLEECKKFCDWLNKVLCGEYHH